MAAPLEGLNLPECPTYFPSEEEWLDPLKFISSIRAQAEPYGICKIVPPASWKPTFAIDKDSFRFPTRIQCVHELQHRTHIQQQSAFYDDFYNFMEKQGKPVKKTPVYCGRNIDLFRFYKAVQKRGGYHKATNDKKWKDISKILQVCRAFKYACLAKRTLYLTLL